MIVVVVCAVHPMRVENILDIEVWVALDISC